MSILSADQLGNIKLLCNQSPHNSHLLDLNSMAMKQISVPNFRASTQAQEGFTLVESLVAMLMMLATLGGLIPVFMSYRLVAIDNQIKTGAIAVAQTGLEEVRQSELDQLPAVNDPVSNTSTVEYMGKSYTRVITYCPLEFDDESNDSNDVPSIHCAVNTVDDQTKKDVQIAVSYNNNEIVEIKTVYTSLE